MSATFPYRNALIVGAGPGIGASLARSLRAAGVEVVLAARNIDRLRPLAAELGAHALSVDAADSASVSRLFDAAARVIGEIDIVAYNAGARVGGSLLDLEPAAVAQALTVNALGGFLVAQQAAKHMVPRGHGAILFTGATASIKGFANSAPFAMGKFALRGLAQSAARELGPKGIHVAHFIVDGSVRSPARAAVDPRPDSTLDPDAIAQTYLDVLRQPRSAWSMEVELRPWVERF
jgi:NAD(P)-dependent dehydrogenase (short-subunit alcohol dehydrogenase family)